MQAHASFYTNQLVLHKHSFTPSAFSRSPFLHKPAFTQIRFYTNSLFRKPSFIPTSSSQTNFYMHIFHANLLFDRFHTNHVLHQPTLTNQLLHTSLFKHATLSEKPAGSAFSTALGRGDGGQSLFLFGSTTAALSIQREGGNWNIQNPLTYLLEPKCPAFKNHQLQVWQNPCSSLIIFINFYKFQFYSIPIFHMEGS